MTITKLPSGEVRVKRSPTEKVVFGAIGVVLTAFMGLNVKMILAESGKAEEARSLKAHVDNLDTRTDTIDDKLTQIYGSVKRIEGRLGVTP